MEADGSLPVHQLLSRQFIEINYSPLFAWLCCFEIDLKDAVYKLDFFANICHFSYIP